MGRDWERAQCQIGWCLESSGTRKTGAELCESLLKDDSNALHGRHYYQRRSQTWSVKVAGQKKEMPGVDFACELFKCNVHHQPLIAIKETTMWCTHKVAEIAPQGDEIWLDTGIHVREATCHSWYFVLEILMQQSSEQHQNWRGSPSGCAKLKIPLSDSLQNSPGSCPEESDLLHPGGEPSMSKALCCIHRWTECHWCWPIIGKMHTSEGIIITRASSEEANTAVALLFWIRLIWIGLHTYGEESFKFKGRQ